MEAVYIDRAEIEINNYCNKKDHFGEYCHYCANAAIPRAFPPDYTDLDLFKKIVLELDELNFNG